MIFLPRPLAWAQFDLLRELRQIEQTETRTRLIEFILRKAGQKNSSFSRRSDDGIPRTTEIVQACTVARAD